jgi:dATP pyrophosphohydrolase
MEIKQEIPIKSFVVVVYVCRIENNRSKYLIILRDTPYLKNTWQMVSGKIEKGEKGWEAALRELKEETNLVPDLFYSADRLEQFYEVSINCIQINPIFLAIIKSNQEIKLSNEHKDFKWVTKEEAHKYLKFDHQVETIKYLEENFVSKKPFEFLEIKL